MSVRTRRVDVFLLAVMLVMYVGVVVVVVVQKVQGGLSALLCVIG